MYNIQSNRRRVKTASFNRPRGGRGSSTFPFLPRVVTLVRCLFLPSGAYLDCLLIKAFCLVGHASATVSPLLVCAFLNPSGLLRPLGLRFLIRE
jgi:hypothetical protein